MYELFRYVVFTKSPFFQKTAVFFIIFPKKQPFFAAHTRKFQSFFEKQPHFSRKIPKIHFFSFFPKQAEIKTIFQPFNHTEDSIRAGPSGNAAGGEIRKNSAALLFS